MQVSRRTIARLLAFAFVANLIVMGAGAWYSYQNAPPIPRKRGVPAGMIETADDARRFADFALWTAWIAHTERPGSSHTYTNDWPYTPVAGNAPTAAAMTWSVLADD